jgi:hypothetical protein
VLAGALVLLAFWLRLTLFAPREMGLDGLISVGMAFLDPARLLAFSSVDVHPPLYPFLLSGWLRVAGETFPAARWLSVASGVVAIALVYRLLLGLASRRTALAALLVLAVAPSTLYVSATVRDFVVGLLLSVVTWWLLAPREFGGARGQGPGWQALVVAVTAAALLTWYFHAISLALQLAVFRRAGRRLIAPLVLGGLVAAPWYAYAAFRVVSRYTLFREMTQAGSSDTVTLTAYLNEAGRALLGLLPGDLWSGWLVLPWVALVARRSH